jgi:hypothetical protein
MIGHRCKWSLQKTGTDFPVGLASAPLSGWPLGIGHVGGCDLANFINEARP